MRRIIKAALCVVCLGILLTAIFVFEQKKQQEDSPLLLCLPDTYNLEIYEQLAKRYMEQSGRAEIEIEVVDAEIYEEYLLSSFSQKNAPDIFFISSQEQIGYMADKGYLLDISDEIHEALLKNSFIPSVNANEPVWAIPINGTIPLIFYNREIFTQNDLTRPENLSDFLRVCAAIQLCGTPAFSMYVSEDDIWGIDDFIENIMVNSADWSLGPLAENGDLNSGFYDLHYISVDLHDKILPKEQSPRSHSELLELFANGGCAMIPGTSEDIFTLNQIWGREEYGMFAITGIDNSRRIVFQAGTTLAISEKSAKQEEAIAFIAFLLSEESQSFLHRETNLLPVTRGVPVGEYQLEAYQILSASEVMGSFLDRLTYGEYTVCITEVNNMFSGLDTDSGVFIGEWVKKLRDIS